MKNGTPSVKLNKIDGKTLKEWVELLKLYDEGCAHMKVADTFRYELDVCVGWHDGGDGWRLAWKIGCQSPNNAMQTDMDIDFDAPYDSDGNVFDCVSEIPDIKTMKEWNGLAKKINGNAKEAYEFAVKAQ